MSDYTCYLNEYQWENIYKYLKSIKGLHIGNEVQARRFVEGIFWMLRAGTPWRMIPKEYGNWNHMYQRFAAWADKGIWYKMLYYFAKDPDMEYIMIESTILRAHACAAGSKGGSKIRR